MKKGWASGLSLPAEKALSMAQATVDRIDKSRERLFREFVDSEFSRQQKSWFTFKPVTREDVIRADKNAPAWTSRHWEIHNILYGRQYDLAQDVIKAATTGEPIYLTLEDFRLIF